MHALLDSRERDWESGMGLEYEEHGTLFLEPKQAGATLFPDSLDHASPASKSRSKLAFFHPKVVLFEAKQGLQI
jgi:hypothetical protein